ncbi:MAG: peptidylprolyl isomerase [Desulfobacteraceae bacterium]|nr:MAG: peptidylprolyl isomerase [Desulfobacteraceae bacterium]
MSEITAVMATSKGPIRLSLFADKTPVTCANFINLANKGFYTDKKFHRVIADFMIQGGCPYGNGMGGPGYDFEDEFHKDLKHDRAGILSMANAGPGTNGSQFFITHGPTPHLDGAHTVFGAVVSDDDQKVVDSIEQGDTIESLTIEGDSADILEKMSARIKEWNQKVEKIFPKLASE